VKKSAFFIIAFFAFSALYSQKKTLDVSVQSGIGFSTLGVSWGPIPNKLLVRPSFGLGVGYNFSKRFSIQSNCTYRSLGAVIPEENLYYYTMYDMHFEAEKAVIKYNYLTIDFLFKYSVGNRYRFFINAGPYFDKFYSSNSYYVDKQGNKAPYYDYFGEINNNGLAGGLGFSMPMGEKIRLSLEYRNYSSVTTINSYIKKWENLDKTYNTCVVSFSYKFFDRKE
jgi:hypothetical protein